MPWHIFQIPTGHLVFRVLPSLMCNFLLRFYKRITVVKERIKRSAMLMHSPCRRFSEDLPKSVDVDFVHWFSGQSWSVDFLYRRHWRIDCELPWQHFRWRYKQSNRENTITCFRIDPRYNLRYEVGLSPKLEHIYIYIYIYIYNFSAVPNFLTFSTLTHVSIISPSKLAFHYSRAWVIVSITMPVPSTDFWYN